MIISIYFPKNVENYIKICKAYLKTNYPNLNFSSFIVTCVKSYIAQLPKEEKRKFDLAAEEVFHNPEAKERINKYYK